MMKIYKRQRKNFYITPGKYGSSSTPMILFKGSDSPIELELHWCMKAVLHWMDTLPVAASDVLNTSCKYSVLEIDNIDVNN